MSENTNAQYGLTEQSLSQSQNNSESTSLIEAKEIEGTPFHAVRKEERWHLMYGKYIILQGLKSETECIESLTQKNWEIALQLMLAIMHADNEYKQMQKAVTGQ